MLTGAGDVAVAVESLKQGASDFILKPVDLDQILLSAERALERRQLLIEHREHHVLLEYRVAEATRELAAALGELQQTYLATLEALGSALATREVGTELHSRRVHAYSIALARAHRLPEGDLEALGRGVLLHDIGKIGISDAILLKPGPLTPEEWQVMRRHPEVGRQLWSGSRSCATRSRSCTTTTNGGTAPATTLGLAGPRDPAGAARIFAVADALRRAHHTTARTRRPFPWRPPGSGSGSRGEPTSIPDVVANDIPRDASRGLRDGPARARLEGLPTPPSRTIGRARHRRPASVIAPACARCAPGADGPARRRPPDPPPRCPPDAPARRGPRAAGACPRRGGPVPVAKELRDQLELGRWPAMSSRVRASRSRASARRWSSRDLATARARNSASTAASKSPARANAGGPDVLAAP